jgi:hypothetical protein
LGGLPGWRGGLGDQACLERGVNPVYIFSGLLDMLNVIYGYKMFIL